MNTKLNMDDFKFFLFEKKDSYAILKINRANALNALNSDLLREFDVIIDQLAIDKEIRCLIITGEGKAFVSGADIAEMSNMTRAQAKDFAHLGHRVFRKIENLPYPTIAAVNGFALGGGMELALSCDMIIASQNAKFGQPEVGLGITPGFGGTQRLRDKVQSQVAKMLIFTGKIIKAEEAKSLEVILNVVPLENLLAECESIAKEISSKSPNAIALAKKAMNEGFAIEHEKALQLEEEYFSDCFLHSDQKDGMTSFLNKKQAVFTERT